MPWKECHVMYDLGHFDDETCRHEPIDNPFDPKCYLCARNNPSPT